MYKNRGQVQVILRDIPKVALDLRAGYATLLAKGFDGLMESFNVTIPVELAEHLDRAKAAAAELDEKGKALATVLLAGKEMQIAAHGAKGGACWLLKCPDFSIKINSGREWGVVVEYEPCGLWQIGVAEIRAAVQRMVKGAFDPVRPAGLQDGEPLQDKDWIRLSKAHFAYDFYSPAFTAEMVPDIWNRIIQHSSSKKKSVGEKIEVWGRAGYFETLTMGSKATLQVQVYDKGKHINEKTGNVWFLKVWERAGYFPPDDKKLKDVWRVELRYGSEFLKDRNILTFDEFCDNAEHLFAEALTTKRIVTDASTDNNLRRRAMCPLWSMAYAAAGQGVKMLPIGRQRNRSAEEYRKMLAQNIAGCARAAEVLIEDSATSEGMRAFAVGSVIEGVDDPQHAIKTEIAKGRYYNQRKARS